MGQQPYSGGNSRARYVRSAFATLILIALLTLFTSAGVWQLNRAGEKHDLNAAFAAGSVVTVLDEVAADHKAQEYRFRRFELTGRYDPDHQILLDNIVADGRNGYQVITPFNTGNQTVLINRGWLAANADRRILPDIIVGGETRTISARLNKLPVPGIRLEGLLTDTGEWPRRLLFPTRDELSALLGTAVPDYQLLLDADQADGYSREWKAVDVGPQKHYGYAFQWFSFALLTIVFYVILNVRWTRQHKLSLQADNPND